MNKQQQRLHRKRLAYIRTFCGDGQDIHGDGKRVLADLKRFCGINRGGIVISPVSRTVDPYATIYQSGMRDVYLRISKMLDIDETDINEEVDHADTSTTASAG
jgi:hypothetical protein